MNPLIQGKSGTTPVMSRNAFSTNQGTKEDDSQSDPHPEAGIFGNQTMRNFGQKDRRENLFYHLEIQLRQIRKHNCRSISAKPTGKHKEKDNPKFPEK